MWSRREGKIGRTPLSWQHRQNSCRLIRCGVLRAADASAAAYGYTCLSWRGWLGSIVFLRSSSAAVGRLNSGLSAHAAATAAAMVVVGLLAELLATVENEVAVLGSVARKSWNARASGVAGGG